MLINEFGEVGIDHYLLERVDEATVLLASGCLCCTIRGDLSRSVRDLYDRRERGLVPAFDRLVIETTGLADPAPIVATFAADPVLRHHFRPGNIVTVVDARLGRANLETYEESLKQVAVADRLVISKTDIAEAGEVERLRGVLRGINRTAPPLDAREPLSAAALLAGDVYDPDAGSGEVRRWLAVEERAHDHDENRHGEDIVAVCLSSDSALDWSAFAVWLTMLLNRHGRDILRVKGLLNIAGVAAPVVVHGVQHTIHPPTHLDAWPDGVARTRLIVIARGLVRARLEDSFSAFNALAAA